MVLNVLAININRWKLNFILIIVISLLQGTSTYTMKYISWFLLLRYVHWFTSKWFQVLTQRDPITSTRPLLRMFTILSMISAFHLLYSFFFLNKSLHEIVRRLLLIYMIYIYLQNFQSQLIKTQTFSARSADEASSISQSRLKSCFWLTEYITGKIYFKKSIKGSGITT